MKKIVYILLFVNTAVLSFAASEELQVYSYLYNSAPSHSGQLGILQSMENKKIAGAGEFYAQALHRLVSEYPGIRDNGEKDAAHEQAVLLAARIGSEKFNGASADLWTLAARFSDAQVKAEAFMSLGKIRAAAYLPRIVNILNTLNAEPALDRQNAERIAFGAIIALEKYADNAGYLPVFFASVGWYSDRIKKQAANSLALISKNPQPFITEIIKGADYSYAVKYAALQTIESADIPSGQKAAVAFAALPEGWGKTPADAKDKSLANMRKLSLDMIARYGLQNEQTAACPLIDRCYTGGIDIDEKQAALAALASVGGDEAAQLLVKYLTALNDKQKTGNVTRDDNTLAQAIITAMGSARHPAALPVLKATQKLKWDSKVKKLVKTAIRQIPKK